MRKASGVVVGALLALTGAQPVFASDAVAAQSMFIGEEITLTTRIAAFELNWKDDPTTIAIGDPAPINWGIGLDLGGDGLALTGNERFAVLTGISGGVPTVKPFADGNNGILDDITGADAAAFAAFISAGPGVTNLSVFGVGEVQSITGVTSGTTLNFSNVANPAGQIPSQLTFTLNGLPIASLAGIAPFGVVTTSFGPGGSLVFVEDHDLDFNPTSGGAGLPLTTAQFNFANGDYNGAGIDGNKDANTLGAGEDPQESLFLSWTYAPTGTDSLSLTEIWQVPPLFAPGNSVVALNNGVTYFIEGSSQFNNQGRPFLLTGGSGAGFFLPGDRWLTSGQLIFGRNNPTLGIIDDPTTFSFEARQAGAIGALPQLRGGPVIPEVSSLWLLGMGLGSFGFVRRRKLLG